MAKARSEDQLEEADQREPLPAWETRDGKSSETIWESVLPISWQASAGTKDKAVP